MTWYIRVYFAFGKCKLSRFLYFISHFFFHLLVLHAAVENWLWNQGSAYRNSCSAVDCLEGLLRHVVAQVGGWNSFLHLRQVPVSHMEFLHLCMMFNQKS